MKIKYLNSGLYMMLIGMLSLTACNDSNKEPDKVAEEKNDAKFPGPDEKDANALTAAYSGSLFEKALSDSVKNWSTNKETKALADSMAKAHNSINRQLKDLADKKAISVPVLLSTSQQDKIAKLKVKTQENLSKDYVGDLIADHKDAISMYEQESSGAMDSTIKEWFQNSLPILRKHLDMATMYKEKLDKKK